LEAPNQASASRNSSEPLEIKTEYVQQNGQSFSPSFKRIGDPSSHDIQNAPGNAFNEGYSGDRVTPAEKEQQVCQVILRMTSDVKWKQRAKRNLNEKYILVSILS